MLIFLIFVCRTLVVFLNIGGYQSKSSEDTITCNILLMYYGNDGQLDMQINMLFNKHDYNGSGFLGTNELVGFLNDLFAAMGHPYRLNYAQTQQILYQIDRNCDGRASRKEVKLMYRQVVNNSAMYGFGSQGGYGSGFNQGGFGGSINLGGGFNQGYNSGYGGMGGFSYTPGTSWNGGHDQHLQGQIDRVYAMYDQNRTGQLEQHEFFNAYRDLCLALGQTPPYDFQSIQQIARQTDTNFDGRVSKQEMYALFKRAQFNLY